MGAPAAAPALGRRCRALRGPPTRAPQTPPPPRPAPPPRPPPPPRRPQFVAAGTGAADLLFSAQLRPLFVADHAVAMCAVLRALCVCLLSFAVNAPALANHHGPCPGGGGAIIAQV